MSERRRRWTWVALALVLVLGACAARYVSLGPEAQHRFDLGNGDVRDIPLISPTLLGWILPGDQTRVESAQFAPDGRCLYLLSGRGVGDQLATATVTRPKNSVLLVELRLITIPSPGRPAIGLYFGTRVCLDQPIGETHLVRDASTGDQVGVDPFIP